MAYKSFRVKCVTRILLLSLSIFLFFFLLFKTDLFAALIITGAMILYQIVSLIRFVDKTNRDLSRFFESIKYSDFSQSFKDEGLGKSFASLHSSFSDVVEAFRKTRSEKEEHFRYLQTVVQHVPSGLIAFQPDGKVELINAAAKKLLEVQQITNIKSLQGVSQELIDTMFRLKPRERALVKVEDENEALQLALYATEFKLRGQSYTLVSLHNIRSELEEQEIEAWQKLIRVLTHEIMNSITPISSLASTISALQDDITKNLESAKEPDKDSYEDIQQAAKTIQKRSQGLLHFVDAYRNLTLIPKPEFRPFPLKELFDRVTKLMQSNIQDKSIKFSASIEPAKLEMTADPELLEQILINLLLNALQAVEATKNPIIKLRAHLDGRNRVLIQVKDNGLGITKENMEKIFIPFYSTKEGGSGIGLSLSRQIMSLHNGTIGVHSEPGKETAITLRF
ncbi:PAS domain-containing sensor histidine kinase [Acidobacteriota bacterium]